MLPCPIVVKLPLAIGVAAMMCVATPWRSSAASFVGRL